MSINKVNHLKSSSSFNTEDFLQQYGKYWKWYLVAFLLIYAYATFQMRYVVPIYSSTATIMIKHEAKNDGGNAAMGSMMGMNFASSSYSLQNEIEVLKSYDLSKKIVNSLQLQNNQFLDASISGLTKNDLYGRFPYKMTVLDNENDEQSVSLYIKAINEKSFKYSPSKEGAFKTGEFDEVLNYSNQKIIISKTSSFYDLYYDKDVILSLTSTFSVALSLSYSIQVKQENQNSNVLDISLLDGNQNRANDIVNSLIKVYNQDALENQNRISKNTSSFLEDRMGKISKELEAIEFEIATYKEKNLTSPSSNEGNSAYSSLNEQIDKKTQKELELSILKDLITKVAVMDVKDYIPLYPFSLNVVNSKIEEYNSLLGGYKDLAATSNSENPLLSQYNKKLKRSVLSIENIMRDGYKIKSIELKEINKVQARIQSDLQSIPRIEMQFKSLMRQQQTKEELYLFLLQKKEEAGINLAIAVSTAKIMKPTRSGGVISTTKAALLKKYGLLIILLCSGLIYIRELFNNKVHSKNDILKAGLPFVGDIPQGNAANKNVVLDDNEQNLSEAFRVLRTNIEFLLTKANSKEAKCIMVTSTVPKEGKTFVSINLALSIAKNNKKVLLIGLDLRNPKLSSYTNVLPSIGLSNYLSNNKISEEDTLYPYPGIESCDVCPSGPIPPNPSEIIQNERLATYISWARKHYDYIVIDSAPVSLVTDTVLLKEYADTTIYVTRAHYLKKNQLAVALDLIENKSWGSIGVLLNGVQNKGYSYGYGYINNEKSVFQKIWDSLKKW